VNRKTGRLADLPTQFFLVALMVLQLVFLSPTRAEDASADEIWNEIKSCFSPPNGFAGEMGNYRSPLLFEDGRRVNSSEDWRKRRKEIRDKWHGLMGNWPPLLTDPNVTYLDNERRGDIIQHRVQFSMTPQHSTEGYLLVPPGDGPLPAVITVYYEPETAIGRKGENRDFALALARRGYVTLSMGTGASIYYPTKANAELQPLSALAYAAANAYQVVTTRDEVDPNRVGIAGHSYGGKWAMFASCLYDKFACAAWSDPGIVFDETRGNVNYWEPWYLGYDPQKKRPAGIPDNRKPRTGAYKTMVEQGWDLHELHSLMAPRPFLVSGGAEDPPQRWIALNHTVAVNKLLGYRSRVAMTNRPHHSPTPKSNEQMYNFFDYFLKRHEIDAGKQ